MRKINEKTFEKLKNNVAVTPATSGINWDYIHSMTEDEMDINNTALPRIYQIELTNICNLKCVMCPYPQMTRPKHILSVEDFQRILDNGVLFPQTIELQVFGESTINPFIGEMIKRVNEKGCKASLSTNATFLSNEMLCRQLMDLDAIVLSIDGATKETYESIRGASFEHIIECVKKFMKIRSEYSKKPYVAIQIISMNATKEDQAKYMDFWKEFGADEIRVKYLLDSMGGNVMLDEVKKQTGRRRACTEAMSGLTIRADGSAGPCCRDFDGKVSFGNLIHQNILDIWNSEEAVAFRQSHLNGEVNTSLCANCNEWNLVNLRFMPQIALTHFKGADIRINELYKEE